MARAMTADREAARTQAQRKFDLLVQRGTPEIIAKSIDVARAAYLGGAVPPGFAEKFKDTAQDLVADGAMTSNVRTAWRTLLDRVTDTEVMARLDRISDHLVLGRVRRVAS
jgi:hypothetical protein